MARYFSVPNAPASNPLAEAITKAISGFQQGFGMARGVKLENEDRARAEEDRRRQQERQAEADAIAEAIRAQQGLFRGTAPVDQGSVMSGVSLPSAGAPESAPMGAGPSSIFHRVNLPSGGQQGGTAMPSGPSSPSSLTQPVSFDLPSAGMDMAGAPAMSAGPMRPPGSFDPTTGTFVRAGSPIAANLPQGSRFEQLTPGFYTDRPGRERDARETQRQEMERAFTDAMRMHEGEAAIDERFDVLAHQRRLELARVQAGLRPPPRESNRDFSNASMMRSQYNGEQAVKDATQVAAALGTVRSALGQGTAAGDMAGIFAMMKAMDPGSTVREGEYANAQNAAGVPQRIQNLYNKAKDGQILSPDQRADFLKTAQGMAESRHRALQGVNQRYSEIAGRYGVDPRDVIYDPFAVSGSQAGDIDLSDNPYRR